MWWRRILYHHGWPHLSRGTSRWYREDYKIGKNKKKLLLDAIPLNLRTRITLQRKNLLKDISKIWRIQMKVYVWHRKQRKGLSSAKWLIRKVFLNGLPKITGDVYAFQRHVQLEYAVVEKSRYGSGDFIARRVRYDYPLDEIMNRPVDTPLFALLRPPKPRSG